MTDKAISPLRRRMIEDLTIRKPRAEDASILHPRRRELHYLPWPLAGPGKRGGPAALSAASGRQRRLGSEPERHRDGVAVLLHGDAWARRDHGAHALRPRAAQAARRLEPGRGRALPGSRARPQVPGGAERGLW